jgi:general secretion pathway protein K
MATSNQRGSALLFVLWVSAALAAIAFSLSSTVLGETERTSTDVDGLRAYYLAVGGLERAEYERLWSLAAPQKYTIGRLSPHAEYTFPSGQVGVDIIPETAKLDINGTPPEELYRLLEALGVEPERASQITAAIVDWRTPSPSSQFDQYYLSLTPSFRSRHASFEEIEELLSVRGVTPELFYGTYVPAPEGAPADGPRLIPRIGLIDCVSVFGSRTTVDANTAAGPVLAAIGLTPDAINVLLQRRRVAPLTQDQLSQFLPLAGSAGGRLRLGGNSIYTMRATGRLRLANGQLSDLRRTVGALVKYMPAGYDAPIHVLRWYDTAWSN